MRATTRIAVLLASVLAAAALPLLPAGADPVTCASTTTPRAVHLGYGPCGTFVAEGPVEWAVEWTGSTRGLFRIEVVSMDGQLLTTESCDLLPGRASCVAAQAGSWASNLTTLEGGIYAAKFRRTHAEAREPVQVLFSTDRNSDGATFRGTVHFTVAG